MADEILTACSSLVCSSLDAPKVCFIHLERFFRAAPYAFVMSFEALDILSNAGQGKRLVKMKQENPEMMEALEEDLRDFHGRIEKSSTWWCPNLQAASISARKKVLSDVFSILRPIKN